MKNNRYMDLSVRKFKLYPDNKKYTTERLIQFAELCKSARLCSVSEMICEQDAELRDDFFILAGFLRDGLIDSSGNLTLTTTKLDVPISKDDIPDIIGSSACFDINNRINGWLVAPDGRIFAVKNHGHCINLLTLMGVDCSNFIRVTNLPVGLTHLNFSNASDYIDTNRPFIMTKEQVHALNNIKKIEEYRKNEIPLDFRDYMIDSLLGGFVSKEQDKIASLKALEEVFPDINVKYLLRDVEFYKKRKDKYQDDFGKMLML